MNNIRVIQFKTTDAVIAQQAFAIRKEVFVKEQQVDESDEFDEFEDISHHFLLYADGQSVATARWRFIGDKIKLERFAVLKSERGRGYGKIILDAVLQDVIPLKKPIYMHAQLHAVPFYAQAGFVKTGDLFDECGIQHYTMYLE